ncbi:MULTISPECIES: agmatine deiminase [unclassified Ruminococcus]|uniref:agmatine deiminase n=1 Tax=unclassified Ruminococcus TaxID=2608920 RepID=UPI00210A09FF|nr:MULTISPECIES: agmatine deiminase [unclassified Ruminococcus]MCQ4022628.1 agmatine deiminase [Ruminococcus sp. zg-924]MCQ4114868.1 agmatine deiminase [Ruminococcus sp. zg-921]
MSDFIYILGNAVPVNDGYYMPAEFSPHCATIMIWPYRPGSWCYEAKAAERVFTQIITEISKHERVIVLAGDNQLKAAQSALSEIKNVEIININSDDAWARDTAPTFLVNSSGDLRAVDWCFNAWGGNYDGLYASWKNDDKIPYELCKAKGIQLYDAHPFVLEGGSIHTDGEGTLITTEECLLSAGRNPQLTRLEIEEKLKAYLGVSKIIWLPKGIYNDETNGHIDNICAFIAPAEVVLAWTDNKDDPQYEISKKCLEVIQGSVDAQGRKIKVHKLPIPQIPVCVTDSDLLGYDFEPGEDVREAGERLAASYVNFYFCNDALILPQFGGENIESDKTAAEILKSICPNREIVPIYAREIILGGGNIHCITQQIPQHI